MLGGGSELGSAPVFCVDFRTDFVGTLLTANSEFLEEDGEVPERPGLGTGDGRAEGGREGGQEGMSWLGEEGGGKAKVDVGLCVFSLAWSLDSFSFFDLMCPSDFAATERFDFSDLSALLYELELDERIDLSPALSTGAEREVGFTGLAEVSPSTLAFPVLFESGTHSLLCLRGSPSLAALVDDRLSRLGFLNLFGSNSHSLLDLRI